MKNYDVVKLQWKAVWDHLKNDAEYKTFCEAARKIELRLQSKRKGKFPLISRAKIISEMPDFRDYLEADVSLQGDDWSSDDEAAKFRRVDNFLTFGNVFGKTFARWWKLEGHKYEEPHSLEDEMKTAAILHTGKQIRKPLKAGRDKANKARKKTASPKKKIWDLQAADILKENPSCNNSEIAREIIKLNKNTPNAGEFSTIRQHIAKKLAKKRPPRKKKILP